MKTAAVIVSFALLAMTNATVGKPLAAYRDQNRVLLVFAASAKDATYLAQTKLWKNEQAGFDDRQLVVMPVFVKGTPADADAPGVLAKRFGVGAGKFEVILIGKDGHDAYRSDQPVRAGAIYERIDAMPMRREEMRRKEKN